MKHVRFLRKARRRALAALVATVGANVGLGYVAAPASAQTVLQAESASWGGTCGSEGQAQSTHAASGGSTVVFLGGDGCAVSFSVAQASTVQEVRWYGGGTAGSICGTFAVVQNGTELARTAQSCSTGGASPDEFKTPAFAANTVQAGTFQIVWHPTTGWHDAHFDWASVAASGTVRREAESATFGGTCGSEGQAQSSHGTASGATVVFLGGDGCAVTFSTSTSSNVRQVRWYGGGTAGSICGTFAVVQNGTEVTRTAQSCSTGGANPDDFQAPVFPANSIGSGSFQIVWHPTTGWHDAHVDWVETIAAGGGGGNNPPTACINTPSISGRTMSVSSCSTDPDNDPLTYDWNWGDGTARGTGSSASHTYACPGGSYVLTLTVNDGRGGIRSVSRNVTATDPDGDADGITNCMETSVYGTSPTVADSDSDGINDGAELGYWGAGTWNTDYDLDGSRSGTSCAAWLASNLCDRDADSDGILDGMEINHPTATFGSNSAYWPNPRSKDLYIEIDHMVKPDEQYTCYVFFTCTRPGYSMKPTDAQLQKVRDAFSARGIRVVFDNGELGKGGQVPYRQNLRFGGSAGTVDFQDYKRGGDGVTANFDVANRYRVFHYLIMGYNYAESPSSSGAAWGTDDDFFASYGYIKDDGGSGFGYADFDTAIAGTIIHELGHNLCLVYGATSTSCTFPGIDRNYGATYKSSMNYDYQMKQVDYSTGALGANDHNDWAGIQLDNPLLGGYEPAHGASSSTTGVVRDIQVALTRDPGVPFGG